VPTGPGWAPYAAGGVMIRYPALKSFLGLCIGCKIFAMLMKLGMIPQDVCADCADIEGRITKAR
jgi:hypothetical protein